MNNNYSLDLLNKELARTYDAIDVLNSQVTSTQDNPQLRKELSVKRDNLRASIKTLEENRGLVITGADGGKMTFKSNGEVTFSGKIEVTPLSVTTNVDMDKYKWDSTDESDESTSFITNFIDLTMKELGLSFEEVKQGRRDMNQTDKFAKQIAEALKRQKGLQ